MLHQFQNGYYLIAGKPKYFRSKWEAYYCVYLEFLKKHKQIQDYQFEPRFFDFPIKHGVTRYLPDFAVTMKDGTVEYHEVKGFMDSKSKTKLKRMAKYYPDVKVVLIDKDKMKQLGVIELGRATLKE